MKRLRETSGGLSLAVAGEETLLGAARRAGHRLAVSCRNGNCGLCHVTLLDGRVQVPGGTRHAPCTIPLCTSRPLGDLTIDALPRPRETFRLACQLTGADARRLHLRLPAGRHPPLATGQQLWLEAPVHQWASITTRQGRELTLTLTSAPALPPDTRMITVRR